MVSPKTRSKKRSTLESGLRLNWGAWSVERISRIARNGKVYATKQVRPVFVKEEDDIIVVTVYTYFS